MQHPDTPSALQQHARRWNPAAWVRALVLRCGDPARYRGGQASSAPVPDEAAAREREWSEPMEPKEFAEGILRDHEQRRHASDRPWRWDDDPEWSGVVALATRWNVDAQGFEAKLERLCRLPTGTARPAAERMLALWRAHRAATRN